MKSARPSPSQSAENLIDKTKLSGLVAEDVVPDEIEGLVARQIVVGVHPVETDAVVLGAGEVLDRVTPIGD